MTCIVGLIEKEKIYMGYDSALSNSVELLVVKNPKVFIVQNKFIIGGCGSLRMMQILNFRINPPKLKKGKGVYDYMCTDFIDEVRNAFKKYGLISENNKDNGWSFMVGFKKRLFIVEDDFNVGENLEPFSSIGSGSPYAMGCMASLVNSKESPEIKIMRSLTVAGHYSPSVREPFLVRSI